MIDTLLDMLEHVCSWFFDHNDELRSWCVVALFVMFVVACGSAYVLISGQEAAAFNRLTGGQATTWDAMWTSLRVVGSEKQ